MQEDELVPVSAVEVDELLDGLIFGPVLEALLGVLWVLVIAETHLYVYARLLYVVHVQLDTVDLSVLLEGGSELLFGHLRLDPSDVEVSLIFLEGIFPSLLGGCWVHVELVRPIVVLKVSLVELFKSLLGLLWTAEADEGVVFFSFSVFASEFGGDVSEETEGVLDVGLNLNLLPLLWEPSTVEVAVALHVSLCPGHELLHLDCVS